MGNDRSHFGEYREQTRVKHEILEKYLRVYFNVLKKWNQNLLFIDGFAGPGAYQDNSSSQPGSPIRALQLIASNDDFTKRVSTVFIEKDKILFSSLEEESKKFCDKNPLIRKPVLINAEFKEGMESILEQFEGTGKTLAPTFLFADPCGVGGVYFSTLARLLNACSSEIFLFFNIDGLKRILGLGEARGKTLAEFLGSEEEAANLVKVIESMTPEEKENTIVARYFDIIRQSTGAKFMTGFKIEKEERRSVSHYLIHITRHDLGFRLMKSVMWSVGKTEAGRGGLALMQKSIQGGHALFDPEWDALKDSILECLSRPRLVSYFYEDLPSQAENLFCEPAYRAALLELEKEGRIKVLSPGGAVTSASTRTRRHGEPTLGKTHTVQLREPGQ